MGEDPRCRPVPIPESQRHLCIGQAGWREDRDAPNHTLATVPNAAATRLVLGRSAPLPIRRPRGSLSETAAIRVKQPRSLRRQRVARRSLPGHNQPRHHARDTPVELKASLGSRVAAHPPFAIPGLADRLPKCSVGLPLRDSGPERFVLHVHGSDDPRSSGFTGRWRVSV
jgi:hypothetical protein